MAVFDEETPTWARVREGVGRSAGSAGHRATLAWAVEQLEEALGDDWPAAAARSRSPPQLLDHLMWAGSHTVAGATVVEWALRLRMIADVNGHAKVRKDIRNDVKDERALHTLVQLTLATAAQRRGLAVELEPAETRDAPPADVRIRLERSSLFVETRTKFQAQATAKDQLAADECCDRLASLGFRLNVWIAGNLRRVLREEELSDLTLFAAAQTSAGGPRVWRRGGTTLTVSARDHPHGALTGPTVGGDTLSLLANAIREKAEKMNRSGAAWLYLVPYTGLFAFTPWALELLDVKLQQLRAALDAELGEQRPAGVVLASPAAFSPGAQPASAADGTAAAVRVAIAPLRARETFVLPFNAAAAKQVDAWLHLARAEDGWLHWGLERFGLAPLDV